MCQSCGCGEAGAPSGDDRHITRDRLEAAAEATGRTVEEVIANLRALMSDLPQRRPADSARDDTD